MRLRTLVLGFVCVMLFGMVAPSLAQDVYYSPLTPGQVVPSVNSESKGSCVSTVSGPKLTVICEHDVADATMAHIHSGSHGTNGGVVFAF